MSAPDEGIFELYHPSQFLLSQNRNVHFETQAEHNAHQRAKTAGSRQCPSTRSMSVPPRLSDPSGIYSSLVNDSDLALAKKKFVKVSGFGEIEFEPDRIDFVVRITSVKSEANEARESVKKRSDYIMSVLKKYLIRDWEINSSELVTRIDPLRTEDELDLGPGQQSKPESVQFKLSKEINVHCDNLMKYHHIYSICHEKLDQCVVLSEPIIKFSPAVIQHNTQRAIRQAVSNAQVKATELIGSQKSPNSKLGQLIYTVEDSLTFQPLDEYDNSVFESFKWKRLNRRVTCKITSVFEISEKLK